MANRLASTALLLWLAVAAGCNDERASAIAQLQDPDPEVRRAAIHSLTSATSEPQDALPILLPLLNDHDHSVRVAAALAVQKLDPKNEACRPILESALRNGQGPVFLEVGRTGANAAWAIPTLLSLLGDRRPPIRALAAQALGDIAPADERVLPALQRGLRDENRAVRKACQQAIDRAGVAESPALP